MSPLTKQARSAAERLRYHVAIVKALQKGDDLAGAVTRTRARAVADLAELFLALQNTDPRPISLDVVCQAIERRVDAFACGGLDVDMVESMGWLLAGAVEQMEREEQREEAARVH